MASVTGYTAARMQEIEDQAIVTGAIVGDNLVLTRYDGGTINAGNVRGPTGATGPAATIPSVARVRVTTAVSPQTLPNFSNTVVDWNGTIEDYDTDGFHSTTTNSSRLTVPTGLAGVYLVSFVLVIPATASVPATSVASAWIQKNASASRYAVQTVSNNTGNGVCLTGTEPIPLSVGDYLQVYAYQNSGISMTMGSGYSYFNMARIGPL